MPLGDVGLPAAAAGVKSEEPRTAGERPLLLDMPEKRPPARGGAVPPFFGPPRSSELLPVVMPSVSLPDAIDAFVSDQPGAPSSNRPPGAGA